MLYHHRLPYSTDLGVSGCAIKYEEVSRIRTSTLSGSLGHLPFVVVPLHVDLSIQVPDFPFAVHVFGGLPPAGGVGPGPGVGGLDDDPGSAGLWPGTNLSHSAIQTLSTIVLDELFERKIPVSFGEIADGGDQ